MIELRGLSARLDLRTGAIAGAPVIARHLGDLNGMFADAIAYAEQMAKGNPLVYTVSTSEPAHGEGQLYYGLGVLMPGRVGREYYFTKGHFHAWRAAAEVYLGLRGRGWMLLEDENESRLLPLEQDAVVYVPGHTAHRTINSGDTPLVYLGIYPAGAGHDYGTIATRNFRKVVVERNEKPVMLDRSEFAS